MKAFLCILLLGLGVAQLSAGEGKIEGAFGKKLGDTFDPGDTPNEIHPSQDELVVSRYRYRFTPTAPFQGLTDYFVEITPTTHRIYSITAIGYFPDEAAIRHQVATLDHILGEKYTADPPRIDGRISRSPVARNSIEGRTIEQIATARSIGVSASLANYIPRPPTGSQQPQAELPRHMLSVTYYDRTLASVAANEIEAIKIAKQAEWNIQEAARQKKLVEEAAKKQAEAEEARQKELVRIKEEVSKLDVSGL